MKKQFVKKTEKSTAIKSFSMLPLDSWERVASPALDYVGLHFNSRFDCFEPPLNRFAIARLPAQNAQHCGILNSRVNMILSGYLMGGLSQMEMKAACLNLVMFGDVGLLKVRNHFGKVMKLITLSSLYLRKKKNGGYRYLMRQSLTDINSDKVIDYPDEDIIFIKLYDPMQQVYGLPDYIGGIQSALLNSDATTFRRRYYANGAHVGFILYATDPDMTEEMEDEVAKNIAQSKGVGNFKSMFVNIPNGNPDGLKVIPIGDTGKKDEFGTIKNVSAQDVLTAHRYPPGLGGVIPTTGSFGDPIKMREAYRVDEVLPMQALIAETVNADPEISGKLEILFRMEAPPSEL